MNYSIRKATKADMPAVLELIKELADFENELDAVTVTVATLEKEGFGEDPLFHVLVAEVEGKIEGMALFYHRFSTWKGRTVHLEDLIVRKEKRGTGLGSALYKEVIKYAQKQGLRRVEWVVADWNQHAIDFYERSGATLQKEWHTVQMGDAEIRNFAESD